jgi:hypothetical protein
MNTIEISCAQPLEWLQICLDGDCVIEGTTVTALSAQFDRPLPTRVQAQFRPFGVRPWVRYNGFLLNYWLANIMLYDHMLELEITPSFYQDYKQRDIDGRLAHVTAEERTMDNLYDKYIGTNNLYPELVREIRDLLA